MEEDNNSSADDFEHVDGTGMDDQMVEPSVNGTEMSKNVFRADNEIDILKTENKVLTARLEIVEQKLKVAEMKANQTNQEIEDKKFEKQFNDIIMEEAQRKCINEQMADKEEKSEEEVKQIVERLDQRMADFKGKIAALQSQFYISVEDQVITAMEMHLEQPRTMQIVLNKSFEFYRDNYNNNNLHRHTEALDLVLRALEMHLSDTDVQLAGIDSMLTIKSRFLFMKMSQDTKERVIQALIDAMEKHVDSLPLVKKCCSGLSCQFYLPQDVLFAYGRVAKLLLKVLEMHESYADIVISQLYKMSFHVEIKQRIEMGETGAIEIMLQQISRKLQADTCSYVMENCWSFLWNIIRGIPANCERFLKAEGLTLLKQCYEKFGEKNPKLMREMMGTILKVAEKPQLRDQLLTNGYLEIFCALLDNLNKDIEISYLSAGILSDLISDDDDEFWIESGVALSRERVNMLIVQAAEKWDLKTRLNINYPSFKHIFHLLSQWHAFGSQHWAMWVLANLTTQKTTNDYGDDYYEKREYCRLITKEEGMRLLEQVSTDSRSTDAIRQLACTVIKNVEESKSNSR